MASVSLPRYAELPEIEPGGDRHAWDVWGRDDQLGAINLLTPERVQAAARLVRTGKVISLNLPLDEPHPGLSAPGGRARYTHHVSISRTGRDDSLDGFYPQFSSQWDGLRHIRNRQFGYWGGRQDADVDAGALGIEHWARHGITGRGVLLDLPRHAARTGQPFEPTERIEITGPLMEQVATVQRVTFQPGDLLLLRTGWLAWYRALDQAGRERLQGSLHGGEGGLHCPGLDPHAETAAWVWDHQLAAVVADNPALEAIPVDRAAGFQHRRLIAMLGIAVGELWDLEALAEDCAADGVYEFMLTAAPLHLPGGVGSPANAYAIK